MGLNLAERSGSLRSGMNSFMPDIVESSINISTLNQPNRGLYTDVLASNFFIRDNTTTAETPHVFAHAEVELFLLHQPSLFSDVLIIIRNLAVAWLLLHRPDFFVYLPELKRFRFIDLITYMRLSAILNNSSAVIAS